MAVSTGAAYLRVQEPKDNISQSLQFWGSKNAELGKEFRDRNETQRIALDKEKKEWEKEYGYNFDDFKAKVTGFDTYDEIQTDYTQKATDKYIELYREAEAALQSGDLRKKKDIEMQMLKVKGSFKQLTEANDHLAKLNESYMDMVNKGEMSGVDADNFEAQMQSILKDKNFTLELDENNSPVMVGVQKNSDGTETPYRIKYSEIVDGTWRPYRKQEMFGDKGIVSNVLGNLGSYEEMKSKGLYTIKSTLWNEKVETGAKSQIGALVSDDETMADLLNQMTGSKEKTDFTDEEKTQVADRLLEMVRGGYKEKYQEEFDKDKAGYTLGVSRLSEDIRKNKANEANARAGLALQSKQLRINEMNAQTNANKVNNDIKLANNPVESYESEPFTMTVKENGKTAPKEFKTFTLRDSKTGNAKNFITGIYRDEKGEEVPYYTPSVSMSADKSLITYKDGGKTVIVNRKKDKTMFELLEGQLSGRLDYNAEGGDMGGANQNNNDPLGLGF